MVNEKKTMKCMNTNKVHNSLDTDDAIQIDSMRQRRYCETFSDVHCCDNVMNKT